MEDGNKNEICYNLSLSTKTFSQYYFFYVIIWKWAFWLLFKLYLYYYIHSYITIK